MTPLIAATLWITSAPVVNMHTGPSRDTAVASQTIYGARLEEVERKGSWIRVETGDRYRGWVHKSGVRKTPKGVSAGERIARVDTVAAHVYREADLTKHAPVLTLPYEARVAVIREADERWIEVRLAGGEGAWIQRGDVTFEDPVMGIGEVARLSRRFLGLPYTWGGASSFGYDCSGFTQMLCRRRGMVLPRDSGPQAEWEGAIAVSREELVAGDLLFFGPEGGKINHTGFYLGDGEFIHATAYREPRIQVSRLSDAHWSELLRLCRRPREKQQQ